MLTITAEGLGEFKSQMIRHTIVFCVALALVLGILTIVPIAMGNPKHAAWSGLAVVPFQFWYFGTWIPAMRRVNRRAIDHEGAVCFRCGYPTPCEVGAVCSECGHEQAEAEVRVLRQVAGISTENNPLERERAN